MHTFTYDFLNKNKKTGRFVKTSEAEVSYEDRGAFGIVITKIIENGEDKTAHYKVEEPEEFALMEYAAHNNWESLLEENKNKK